MLKILATRMGACVFALSALKKTTFLGTLFISCSLNRSIEQINQTIRRINQEKTWTRIQKLLKMRLPCGR